ncbi:hypothetical protein Cni_G26154 [Canna indica]|uniref:Uncharacterized protein n=1 Tax=Canna indica TaxID=4628 RepID=A0AAQ3L1H3_9LILI|nr:hypothetical protein Cni_G26154 [Canna indica]
MAKVWPPRYYRHQWKSRHVISMKEKVAGVHGRKLGSEASAIYGEEEFCIP